MEGPKDAYSWTGLLTWREEKELQEKAKAYSLLKESAENGNVQAQKLIYEGDKKAGRPTKAQIKKAAEEALSHTSSIKEDLKRIKLATVNGKQAASN